jgi:hypothetical protein
MQQLKKSKMKKKPLPKKDGRAGNGGKREGAGNVYKYGEKTKSISICVPISKEAEIRAKIEEILEPYKTNKDGK